MSNNTKKPVVTIFDIARAAGVSGSTVSRVVNNTGRISPTTRARVIAQMEAMGYIPNEHARRLAGVTQSRVIGMLVHALGTEYIGEIIRGIEEHLEKADYDLVLYTTHRHKGREAEYVSSITRQHADGLLLVVPVGREAYLDRLRELHFPCVLVDVEGEQAGSTPSVGTSNYQGAFDATCHLLELGHLRTGFISDSPGIPSAVERLQGYQAALAKFGIAFAPELVQEDNFVRPDARTAVQKLLALANPPTAILTSSDPVAFRVQEVLREANMTIPGDMSLVGFDDTPQASLNYPRLTTVHQPLYEMGATAARMLLEYIDNPELPSRHIQLQTHLIVRESTTRRDSHEARKT